MIEHGIKENLTIVFQKDTTPSDMYTLAYSETLDFLLSTPQLLEMIIEASTNALDKLLPIEYVTVGKHLELDHQNPTLIGEPITLKMKVRKVDGNKVYLEITGEDSYGIFCKADYERVIVNRNHLMQHAFERAHHAL